MTERGRSSFDRTLEGSEVLELARLPSPARVSGVMGPARSLVEAVLASFGSGRERPVLLLVPDERRLPPAVSDLASFLHALGRDRRVLPFPAFALDPYRGLSPHLDVVAARLLQIPDVTGMEEIEAAVGEDQVLAPFPKPPPLDGHFFAAQNLGEAHGVPGGSSRTFSVNSQRWRGR